MTTTIRIYSKGLALVYAFAFLSLTNQGIGLYGNEGIFPIRDLLHVATHHYETAAFFQVPTLFWLSTSNTALITSLLLGILGSALLFFEVTPRLTSLVLWFLFLSWVSIGRVFLEYQWDVLLLEVGFLSIFLSRQSPSVWIVFLFRFLLFRLLFSSGLTKLLSQDPHWRDLTAVYYHYESQPLPNIFAWFLFQFPMWFHKVTCALMFIQELFIPFLIFFGRKARQIVFWSTTFLQFFIILTGNYGYFNYLSIALCFFLLDDQALSKFVSLKKLPATLFSKKKHVALGILSFFLLGMSAVRLYRSPILIPFEKLNEWTSAFHLTHSYGLFSVMTLGRDELFIEGSSDQLTWTRYPTSWKPNKKSIPPLFIAPHMPRIDWQLWFSALSSYQDQDWLKYFLQRILEGSHSVGGLLAIAPPTDPPPKYLRIVSQKYSFTNWQELLAEGNWWKTGPIQQYSGTLSLDE